MKGVGWVFTPRNPVRGVKSSRPVKKLTVTLPDGAKPTIGTTLTPVKTAKTPSVKKAVKAAKAPAKAVKKAVKAVEAIAKPVDAPVKKVAKKAVKKAAPARPTVKKQAKAGPVTSVAEVEVEVQSVAPAPVLRRGRHPVNPEKEFNAFKGAHKIGAKLEGEVSAFTSHGAVIQVGLKGGGHIECYAPTTLLGNPAPARARDVLKRGDVKSFRLINVDTERRIAELGLA